MRIKQLDGLRGVAILMVVAYHFYIQADFPFAYQNRFQNIWPLSVGFLGVQLFFMISGYVIFMTLDQSKGILSFAYRRWIRLFPAMAVASLLIYVAAQFFFEPVQKQINLIDVLPGLLFIGPNYLSQIFGSDVRALDVPFWTLFVEVRFYVLIGLLYFLIGRKRTIWALVLIAGLTTVLKLFEAAGYLHGNFYTVLIEVLGKTLVGNYLYWFLIGIFCYRHANDQLNKPLLVPIVIFLLLAIQPFQDLGGHEITLATAATAAAIGAVFVYVTCFDGLKAALCSPFLVFFGFISYSLYLIHHSLGLAILIKLDRLGFFPSAVLPVIVLFFVTVPAYLMTRYVETNIQTILKKLPLQLGWVTPSPSLSK